MFAYSHLAKLGDREARRLFLGYVNGGFDANARTHLRLPRYSRDDKLLGLLPLPWPARSELSEPEVYRTRLCGELERLLRVLT